MNTYQKLIYLGLALLIIAGVVVVLFKGFNVDLMLKQHEELVYTFKVDYDLEDVNKICKDVFKDKEYRILEYELFGDGLLICSESITEEEKENLIYNLNDYYYKDNVEAAISVDKVTVNSIPNVRIKDWITPYIAPICITYAIIAIYTLIRFRKLGSLKTLLELLLYVVLVVAIILSIIAISRLPLKPYYITIVMVCSMIMTSCELLIFEKRLADLGKKSKTKK